MQVGYEKAIGNISKGWAMRLPTSLQLIVGVSFGTIIFLAIVWSVWWLWQSAGEHDRNPRSGGVSEALMNRKSSAMQDILEGMIRGDLRRVNTAAQQMDAYGDTMEWYVSQHEYDEHGERFRSSVDALQEAAKQRDVKSAKEAVLELERSCIECHTVMNQRNTGSR
jgi:hypothetical protein